MGFEKLVTQNVLESSYNKVIIRGLWCDKVGIIRLNYHTNTNLNLRKYFDEVSFLLKVLVNNFAQHNLLKLNHKRQFILLVWG